MGEKTVGFPLDVVAGGLSDEEGLGAALVAVLVNAGLESVVHDFAAADGLAGLQRAAKSQACSKDGLSVWEIHSGVMLEVCRS